MDALKEMKAGLLEWINQEPCRLCDLSYTLLTGREHFNKRFACVVKDLDELRSVLEQDISSEHSYSSFNVDETIILEEKSAALTSQLEQFCQRQSRKSGKKFISELESIRDLYLEGGATSGWGRVFKNIDVIKLHLPSYPFEKTRFWASGTKLQRSGQILHSLLHENTSTLDQQRYSSVFSGEETFLKDHKVEGRKILPAAAHLELAIHALKNAADGDFSLSSDLSIQVKNVIFMRPFFVDDKDTRLEIEISPTHFQEVPNGTVSKSVDYTIKAGFETENVFTSSQGSASLSYENTKVEKLLDPGLSHPLGEIDGANCYAVFKRLGFGYGASHRAIKSLMISNECILAEVEIPEKAPTDNFYFHPSLVDAALQASVILLSKDLWLNNDAGLDSSALKLPFSLDSANIYAAVPKQCWIQIVLQNNGSQKIDVVIFEYKPRKEGATPVVAEIKGIVCRSLHTVSSDMPSQAVKDEHNNETEASGSAESVIKVDESYYSPLWKKRPLLSLNDKVLGPVLIVGEPNDIASISSLLREAKIIETQDIISAEYGEGFNELQVGRYSFSIQQQDSISALLDHIKSKNGIPASVIFAHPDIDIEATNESAFNGDYLTRESENVFSLVKAYFKPAKKARFLSLVSNKINQFSPVIQGLSGFYKSVRLEKPGLSGCVVACDHSQISAMEFGKIVARELNAPSTEVDVSYLGKDRYVREFVSTESYLRDETIENRKAKRFKEDGLYLITGGMGALGLLFASYLMSNYNATVFLTGRSPRNDEKISQLEERAGGKGRALYLQGDVSVFDDVNRMISDVKEGYGELNGIIHSAGVIEDNFILRKEKSAFQRVVAPKVKGTCFLDVLTKDMPLDLFVTFSSVTGVFGNLGQCDYGYGNSFEDYFAHQRNLLAKQNLRNGVAVSINWPYWKDGGMVLSDKEEEILRKNFGITPLGNQNGLNALDFAVENAITQMAVLEGDQAKIRSVLGVREHQGSVEKAGASNVSSLIVNTHPALSVNSKSASDESKKLVDLKTEAVSILIDSFSRELGISKDRFDQVSNFQSYGFDSVVMIDMVNALSKIFEDLPKTLFFEYQNLGDLADFLVENYANTLSGESGEETHPVTDDELANATSAIPSASSPTSTISSRFFQPMAHESYDDSIVIVGLAGRYPGAENLGEYWNNLKNGKDCVTEVPAERGWDMSSLFKKGDAEQGKTYSKWGGFIDKVDHFDPMFFSISPKEAEEMDPHERLFLETVALAIGDAGYVPDNLTSPKGVKDNPVGVYVGVMWGDYHLYAVDGINPSEVATPHSFYWAIANRISYQFNFSGPSLTIDTACSSSISAIDLACSAIQRGEIDVGIAGGVNLSLHPAKYALLSHLHFLSTDGRCRSFGEGGDGYVPAEGVGAVVLKRKSDALRDGDHIYGVIRSTSVNHGGKTSGFTVPNPNRQAALIKDAIAAASINPREISYVEAHGTGTSLGDPIEISGLTKAFDQQEAQYCAIGSAKSNIGHAEAAAGVAGLSKILLQMKHGQIAPSLHSSKLNPYAKIETSPFRVQQELGEWKRPHIANSEGGTTTELPRIASLSSFGAGGANGHMIVEEWRDERDAQAIDASIAEPALILLSSKKEHLLAKQAEELIHFISQEDNVSLHELAYTLQIGRIGYEFGLATVVSDLSELEATLKAFINGEQSANILSGKRISTRPVANSDEVEGWLKEKDIASLANAWMQGQVASWVNLYRGVNVKRISAPSYMFEKKSYWTQMPSASSGKLTSLHPLIDANVSTLEEQVFKKSFKEEEFYLKDHRLGENAVLPGVAYLEMVAQALNQAAPGQPLLAINNVSWLKPIMVDGEKEDIYIGLYPERDAIEYQIYSEQVEDRIIYSDGQAIIDGYSSLNAQVDRRQAPNINVPEIQSRFKHVGIDIVNKEMSDIGFTFGKSFQVIKNIYFNGNEALGEITLNRSSEHANDYILYPPIVDGIVRTTLGMNGFVSRRPGLPLPVKVSSVVIHNAVNKDCFAYVRRQGIGSSEDIQQQFDIFVINSGGELLLELIGFTLQYVAHMGTSKKASGTSKLAAVSKAVSSSHQQAAVSSPSTKRDAFGVNTKRFLIKQISEATKLSVSEVNPATPFDAYGIDSVMIQQLNNKFIEQFGENVPQTLFFEYQTINELTDYFVENYSNELEFEATPGEEVIHDTQTSSLDNSSTSQISTESASLKASEKGSRDALAVVNDYLISLLAEVTKMNKGDIDLTTSLDSYGVDSVMITGMNEKIVKVFGEDIPKTLFFEYQDLESLAEFFVENYEEVILAELDNSSSNQVSSPKPVSTNDQKQKDSIDQIDTKVSQSEEVDSNRIEAHLEKAIQSICRVLNIEAHDELSKTRLNSLGIDVLDAYDIIDDLQGLGYSIDINGFYSCVTLTELAKRLANSSVQNTESPRTKISALVNQSSSVRLDARARLKQSRFVRGGQIEDDIAIIGLSGRYPQAKTLEEFWKHIANGEDLIVEVPPERWDANSNFSSDRMNKGSVYSKWGSFIDDVDQFDSDFFRIAKRDAEKSDPQERLFLQTAWECIEDAAYTHKTLSNHTVGVFAGVMWGLYQHVDVDNEQLKYGKPTSSFSSIANRVSYTFNFSGPSLALDTMCSSSITAIHMACQSLNSGDCNLALAGGVNLATHGIKYDLLCQEQFLSTDGRCRAFGEGGDGYVPGEGVGVILLKPLQKALANGDQVYAVIKSSAVNHGGKTNGYTVPNQRAQTSVIEKAIEKSGWPAESISYIEAHGTGTSLGDPIEIAGLTKALKKHHSIDSSLIEKCKIGSIKSNIGHLESAAGIVGITKVLLQFKHKKIAPSIHSDIQNPNINFSNTHLEVAGRLEEWLGAPVPGTGNRYPLRAGVSSFGAGGSNAHVLLEDFSSARQENISVPVTKIIFVLSADTEQRLRLYAGRILEHFRISVTGNEDDDRLTLHRSAFTSLIGREQYQVRIAIVVETLQELVSALTDYLNSSSNDLLVIGNPDASKEFDNLFDSDSKSVLLQKTFAELDLIRLAKIWVNSFSIDWAEYTETLFPSYAKLGNIYLYKVSLPTMPFLTQRCWVSPIKESGLSHAQELHPMVSENHSTLVEQKYFSKFTGREFYLFDHVISTTEEKMVLPGVAYLELARFCGQHAISGLMHVRKIKNVVWARPVEVKGDPAEINVVLSQGNSNIEFNVVNANSSDEIYSQGELYYSESSETRDEWIDIEEIKGAAGRVDTKDEIYEEFLNMGFKYGPGFQVTQKRYRLENAALSELELPAHLLSGADQYFIHPSLMDAALRTGLAADRDDLSSITIPIVPFGLDEIELRHPISQRCYAYVAAAGDPNDNDAYRVRKYDVIVTDEIGLVLVKLSNFMAKPFVKPNSTIQKPGLFTYDWITKDANVVEESMANDARALIVNAGEILLEELSSRNFNPIKATLVDDVELSNTNSDIVISKFDASSYYDALLKLHKENRFPETVIFIAQPVELNAGSEALNNKLGASIDALMLLFSTFEKVSSGSKYRCIYIYKEEDTLDRSLDSAASGFAKSLVSVNHLFEMQSVRLMPESSSADTAKIILSEFNNIDLKSGDEIRFEDKHRYIRCLKPCRQTDVKQTEIREGGTYLITGGLGKLGIIFAKYLAEQYKANLILTGRSPLSEARQEILSDIELHAESVTYVAADICHKKEVGDLIQSIVSDHGVLHGIIHSAGVSDDKMLLEHELDSFNKVLLSKIQGTLLLDELTTYIELDFLILFSSISAVIGDLGSGAYACANRFLDSFAGWRTKEMDEGRRFGKTISINWPLWAEGGMQIPDDIKAFFNFSGIRPLEIDEGLEVFEQLINVPNYQVLVAAGEPQKMEKYLRISDSVVSEKMQKVLNDVSVTTDAPIKIQHLERPPEVQQSSETPNENDELRSGVINYIKEKLSDVTNTDQDSIDTEVEFERFGIDSVMLMELQSSLKKDIDSISKTVLFEYDSVSKLANHLMNKHKSDISQVLKIEDDAHVDLDKGAKTATKQTIQTDEPKMEIENPSPTFDLSKLSGKFSLGQASASKNSPISEARDVAIIGVNANFPQASTLEEIWNITINGSSVISEIPTSRWDHRKHYHPEPGQVREKYTSKWGGFLDSVDFFDHEFFNISFEESTLLDPQMKLILQSAWSCLEDSGYTIKQLAHCDVGVYMGTMSDDFTRVTNDLYKDKNRYLGHGFVSSEIANRLSYFMNLHGPSISVQTACSSSMSAMHIARAAIANSECNYALAGGVNVSLHHGKYLMLQDMKVLSPSGKEMTFDADANGLVPCEGVATVLLKDYEQALADGDNIYALIRSSVASSSGKSAGQYLPNIKILEGTMSKALSQAGVSGEDLTYIECHGTGTELGDPIELKALENALNRSGQGTHKCAVGTKANFGHMEAASGMCSLVKVLLSMKHGELAPCANLNTLSDAIDPNSSPFYFPTQRDTWNKNHRGTRVAGINSFGMGGANVFMVLESVETINSEEKPYRDSSSRNDKNIVLLSAESESQLRRYLNSYVDYFSSSEEDMNASIEDIAYTTQVGRQHFSYRAAILASKTTELVEIAKRLISTIDNAEASESIGSTKNAKAKFAASLFDGSELTDFTRQLVSNNNMKKLASMWIHGVDIDWSLLYGGTQRRRVSLPSYPFNLIDTHISKSKVLEGVSLDLSSVDKVDDNSTEENSYKAGEWFVGADEPTDLVELISGSDKEIAKAIFSNHEDWKQQYWLEEIALSNDKYLFFGKNEKLQNNSESHFDKVSTTLSEQALSNLQILSQQHQIQVKSLVIAAWSLVCGRHNREKYAQFGLLDHTLGEDVLPCLIKTVSKNKINEWLANVTVERRLKADAYQTLRPIMDGLQEEVNLWDTIIVIADDSTETASTETAKEARNAHLFIQVMLSNTSVNIDLDYNKDHIDVETANNLLEFYVSFMLNIASSPTKNAAALPMETKKSYQERFRKSLSREL